MKKHLAIVTLSSLAALLALPAGAQELPSPDEPVRPRAAGAQTPAEAAAAAIAAIAAEPAKPKAIDALPSVPLTEELMFKLLTAEIAFQRGEWQAAYVTTLVVAQQTRDPRIARRAAEFAIAAKAQGEALAAVRLWTELAPYSDEAAQTLLGMLVMSDELAAAEPMFVARLNDAPAEHRGLMLLQIQRMLQRAQDKAAGLAMLERLVAPWAALPESHIALAQGAAANGDAARAVREARQALAKKPDSELAVLTLAQVLQDKAEASRALASFIQAHPQAREVRLAQARLLVEQRQYARARNEFEALLKMQPDDLSSLYAVGVLSSQAGDWAGAEKHLSTYVRALNEQPVEGRDPGQALMLLSQVAEERKDIARALAWLAQVERGPSFVPALARRTQLMAKQGRLEAALALLRETRSENDQEQVQLIGVEANLLRENGRVLEALKVMQAGLQRFPNDPDLLYDLAMAAEKADQFDLMEATLRRLIEVAPENQHAYNALGYSLADRNMRLDEAQSLIEKAHGLAPEDPFILDSLGWVHFRRGNLKEAEEALRRAYGMRQDAEIAVHLGEVLWVMGRKDEAQKLFREARSKDPHNDTLKSTLARLQVKP